MTKTYRKLYGKRLENLIDRVSNGDINAFAKKIGKRPGYVQNVISGTTPPTAALTDAVCSAFNVDAGFLTMGVGVAPEPTLPTSPADDLAEAVKKISEGMSRLLASGLNRDAIVVLLKDHTGVPKRQIETVLDGLTDLAKRFTK